MEIYQQWKLKVIFQHGHFNKTYWGSGQIKSKGPQKYTYNQFRHTIYVTQLYNKQDERCLLIS